MKNKIIIYVVVFLAIAIILIGGYYLAFSFGKKDGEIKKSVVDQKEQALEVIRTIREDSFLIHGTVKSIDYSRNPVIVVFIDMSENFEFSPYNFATRNFLMKENSVLYIAQKIENESPIAILEESATIVDSDSLPEEGDLIVIKTEESFDFILDTGVFSIVEMWKIVE